jgi:hypothetical protein
MMGKRKATGRGILVGDWGSHTPPLPIRPSRTPKPRESRGARRERLAKLESAPVPQLFQSCPPMRTPSLYRPKGYTGCLEGFFRSARQRRSTIIRNNKFLGRRFTHLSNINLCAPRHPALINRDFRAFLKELEKSGVTGHWTIEIDRQNIVHWHLLFVDFRGDERVLKGLVSKCLSAVKTFPDRRVHTAKLRNQRQKVDYVLKVRKEGHGKAFNPLDHNARPRRNTACWDIYARERVLFRPNTGLDKHGTFGDFWAEGWNEKKWWNLVCEETAEVARNYKNPKIRAFVDDLHARLGIPLSRVKWAFCLNPPWHLILGRSAGGSTRRGRRATRCSSGLVRLLFLRKTAKGCTGRSCKARRSSVPPVAVHALGALPDACCVRPTRGLTEVVSYACVNGDHSSRPDARRLLGTFDRLQHDTPYQSLGP